MKPTPLLQFEIQRAGGDCGISCIATITGKCYEDVLIVAGQIAGGQPHQDGMYMTKIMQVADILGYPLRKKRHCNLLTDKGILDVGLPRTKEHHVVILMAGLIFDTDASVWVPADYKRAKHATFGSILVPI